MLISQNPFEFTTFPVVFFSNERKLFQENLEVVIENGKSLGVHKSQTLWNEFFFCFFSIY